MRVADSLFLCLNSKNGTVPNRIQILPAGKKIIGADGREWTLSDAAALCARMNASDRARNWCIDENHSTDLAAPEGRPSPAVGWFSNLTVETDGSVWADVEWNARGNEVLSNKEYRFISPVFISDEKKEITEILRAALTNRPNLANPALNASQGEPAEEKSMDKELCEALVLPETATKDEVLAVFASLKKAAMNSEKNGQVDLAAYAPRADLNAMQERAEKAEKQVADMNAASLRAKATDAVEQAVKDGKIAPASKDEYLALCATEDGFDKFEKIMAKTPKIVGGEQVPETFAPEADSAELNAAEKEWASSMGYSLEDWKKIKEAGE